MQLARIAGYGALSAVTAFAACAVRAQEHPYPNRYMRILTSEAGSTNDIVSRIIGRPRRIGRRTMSAQGAHDLGARH